MNVKVSATLALLLFAAASCERTPAGAGAVVRLGGEQRVRPALVAAKPEEGEVEEGEVGGDESSRKRPRPGE